MRDAVSEKVRNKAYHPKVSSDSHVCQGMCVTRPPQREGGVERKRGREGDSQLCVIQSFMIETQVPTLHP